MVRVVVVFYLTECEKADWELCGSRWTSQQMNFGASYFASLNVYNNRRSFLSFPREYSSNLLLWGYLPGFRHLEE